MQSYNFTALFNHPKPYSDKILHRSIDTSLPKSTYQFLDVGYEHNGPDYYHEREYGTTYLLAYTVSGQAQLTYNDKKFTILPGSLTFIYLKDKSLIKTMHSNWEIYFIHVFGSDIDDIYRHATQNENYVTNNFNSSNFIKCIEEIYNSSTPNYDAYFISAKIYSLLMDVLKQNLSLSSSTTINKIVTYINRNYENDISVESICEIFYISKYYFIRKFHTEMKLTPKQYLTSIRLNKAQLLLVQTNKSLNEIARLCGFKTERNLIYSFHKYLNTTPDYFRKNKYNLLKN